MSVRIQKTGDIHIHAPHIETKDEKSQLICDIDFKGEQRTVWFSVDEKYGQYLCWERSDAFLIGLLNFAMREGCDITCDAPVTSQLLYQIKTYLLPLLANSSDVLYHPTIIAPMDDTPLPNAGGVGTGISCGVDSLHVVKNYMHSSYAGMTLTHLTLHNVGAFWKEKNNQYSWHVNHTKAFAKEYGFELIITDSNFAKAFPQSHFLTVTYSNCFAIYAMQKLWHTYFFASAGDDIRDILKLANNEKFSSEDYDLISLDTFSTRSLKIYSEGAAITRLEKIRTIALWDAAQKYLHVCTSDEGENCNHCNKCMRTLLILDALNSLKYFQNVFDIEGYYMNRSKNLRWLYKQIITPNGDLMLKQAYHILSHEISLSDRLCVRLFLLWKKTYARFVRIKPLYLIIHPLFETLRKLKNDRK